MATHKIYSLFGAWLCIFCTFAALLGAQLRAHAAPVRPVRVPIEVMGPDGTTQTVAVSIPAGPPVTLLRIKAHGLTYENKASVRVGNGPWLLLNNTTAQVAEPAKSYGGIGGAFGTLTLTVPIPQGPVASGGLVIVSFRFNATDGTSIGFRVLRFNLLRANGYPTLPGRTFFSENPALWTAPLPDAADIAAGRALWQSAPLVKSGQTGAPPIRAVCADCHTQDGSDLHYFNYSNYSIEQRARFHGLTDVQGRQIASYIRALPGPAPGRPWNPPYQPGPGMDAKPAAEWAAGAGLDAVLDNDADALPYLFPNGVNKSVAATSGTLNMRELPVAFQMLDWNRWLPTVHPKDAFADFGASALPADYANMRVMASSAASSDAAALHNLPVYFDGWWYDRHAFQQQHETGAVTWTPDYARAIYSLSQWQLIKTWEIMQEFALADKGPAVYGAGGEARTWFDFSAFSASPALSGIPEADGLLTANHLQFEYLVNAWYYAGIVLNSGNRHRIAWRPVDWGYSNGRIFDLARQSQVPEMMRYTAMHIKAMQQADNDGGGTFWAGELDRLTAWNGTQGVPAETLATGADGVQSQGPVIEAVAGAWLDKTRQVTPQWLYSTSQANASDTLGLYNTLTTTYSGIGAMRGMGVDAATINALADWGKTVWPAQNWNALKQ